MLPWLPSIYASFESKYSVTSGGLCKEFLESFLYFVYGISRVLLASFQTSLIRLRGCFLGRFQNRLSLYIIVLSFLSSNIILHNIVNWA